MKEYMKKNYDEELLDLSLEVWGQRNQVIVEDSPSEESIIDNEIVVGIYFPDTHMLSLNLTRDFIDKCGSKFGKSCPQQQKSAIGQFGTSMMFIWCENLKDWRKRTHDVKKYKELYSDGGQEMDLSDIYESLKFFAEETGANQASCETEDEEWRYIVTAIRKEEDK
jgi:hypothetical protein